MSSLTQTFVSFKERGVARGTRIAGEPARKCYNFLLIHTSSTDYPIAHWIQLLAGAGYGGSMLYVMPSIPGSYPLAETGELNGIFHDVSGSDDARVLALDSGAVDRVARCGETITGRQLPTFQASVLHPRFSETVLGFLRRHFPLE